MPQWSAVGAYASSGAVVDDAYGLFLDLIEASTTDPKLEVEIQAARNDLTGANNAYEQARRIARSRYDATVANNNPTFEDWLASPAGRSYESEIAAAEEKMESDRAVLTALTRRTRTPGLNDANAQYDNQQFLVELADSNLQKVRGWTVAQTATDWLTRVQSGDGAEQATVSFVTGQNAYDFGQTWAGGESAIDQWFWAVEVNSQWQRIDQFESSEEIDVSISFDAFDLIQIQPTGWYNGSLVNALSKGPFVPGYSPDGSGNTKAVFGQDGFFNLLKTGMYVAHKPSFMIRTNREVFRSFQQTFRSATRLRIGPFVFAAGEGGSEQAGWNADQNGSMFTGASTSESPMIVGVQIMKLPGSRGG